MKKSDLKSGMIIESKGGERYILVDNILLSLKHWMKLEIYNDNLLVNKRGLEALDIMKIYKSKEANLNSLLGEKELELIWERNEIDWSKVSFGTKVRCWDSNKSRAKEGKFLDYINNTYYPFRVYINHSDYNEEVSWRHCELI